MKVLRHKLLTALVEAAKANEDQSITIECGSYMPLHVQWVGTQALGDRDLDCWSISHTYEQNGDLMRDPEMCFMELKSPIDGFLAYQYRQDGLPFPEQISIREKTWSPRLQADQTTFARRWMANMRQQGFEDKVNQLMRKSVA